jgi:hypothetical protein
MYQTLAVPMRVLHPTRRTTCSFSKTVEGCNTHGDGDPHTLIRCAAELSRTGSRRLSCAPPRPAPLATGCGPGGPTRRGGPGIQPAVTDQTGPSASTRTAAGVSRLSAWPCPSHGHRVKGCLRHRVRALRTSFEPSTLTEFSARRDSEKEVAGGLMKGPTRSGMPHPLPIM